MLWEFRAGLPVFQVVALGLVMGGQLVADQVAIASLPRPVVATVEDQFPGASWRRVETKDEDGRVVHEVTVRRDGVIFEVSLTSGGEVAQVERHVPRENLPEAVKHAIGTHYPGAAVRRVEEVRRGDQVVLYEVTIAAGRRGHLEVLFDPAGQVAAERRV